MLAAPTHPSSYSALPLAVSPVFTLFRRQAHMRRQALSTLPVDDHAERQRWSSNAEANSLLLEHTLASWLDPPTPTTLVSLTERLATILHAISSVVETTAPPEMCVPAIQNQLQRQCSVRATDAVVIEHIVVCLLLAAVDDGALTIVVCLTRTDTEQIVLEIESDVPGLVGSAMSAQRHAIEHTLQALGLCLQVEERPNSWLVRIGIPAQPMTFIPFPSPGGA